MPSNETERAIVLRRFDGVNQLVDQAFLGPSYLAAAENFMPGLTYRLEKVPGNAAYIAGQVPDANRVLKMTRVYSTTGTRYLYAVVEPLFAPDPDQLWFTTDDNAWERVQLSTGGDADFTERGAIYDFEMLNGIVYVGNGIDPIYAIPVGEEATPLAAIAALASEGGGGATVVADPGSQILCGTYAYAWAIFDENAGIWAARGQTRTVTTSSTGDQSIEFATPTWTGAPNSGTISAAYTAHLFVAPINLPIEFAHDQTPGGLDAAGTQVIRALTADGPPLPLRGVARTGRIFRAHFSRLWIAGDQVNLTSVWATYPVSPGLEQAVFNAGIFFPYNARLPRTFSTITALGVAATGRDSPDAPIIVTTLTDTYLNFGDILDDPSQQWVRVSATVGCIGKDTMVETPYGAFWIGLQSVYYMPPGGGVPIDVGWPIRPSIEAIPVRMRSRCVGLYHKGFVKYAIVPNGATTATEQWWLDLSQGVGQIPSWWGPSPRVAVSCWCTGQQDPAEPDRGFQASDLVTAGQLTDAVWDVSSWDIGQWSLVGAASSIEIIHQFNTYSEYGTVFPIHSLLQTGDLDDDQPFMRKLFTRVRTTAFPVEGTTVAVAVAVDGSNAGTWDDMNIPSVEGAAEWDVSSWNVGLWGRAYISEGESVSPESRPRGRTGSVRLTHTESCPLSLRDFELRYLPVPREVRSLPDDPTS